ncbi:E3 ubiquitin-protein ligase RNF4-like [Abrus precatorius]|uniref:E3 ubiquitin-protein ligase RNF4-like n=1 Tax=Abrus precatorius TaxID=3816 RepID=A0A8B8LZU5_ABRPR|nr:E3 ubiquitin-protein ligase RNF4-like [Abrus precatorius]
MSSRAVRTNNRRRKTPFQLDLNSEPPENLPEDNEEGPSIQVPMIDVDAIDDDVIESSPRAFAQAKNNSRRIRRRTVVDVDLEDRARQDPQNQTVINLESSSSSMSENARKSPEPPKEPVFNCPICMGPLVEEMSTKCGHIFCKGCIKTAVTAQGKCPTCRKKVYPRDLIRVFLPATS